MTNNQIQYLKYLEDRRHNVVAETELNRDNTARLSETSRYNTGYLGETSRSNKSREMETNRSNLANEDIARQGQAINKQHYANQDAIGFYLAGETNRHNLMGEKLGILNYNAEADYKDRTASTGERNASTNAAKALYDYQTDRRNAATREASQSTEAKLRKAQTIKTYVNTGTDIMDSYTNAWEKATRSLSNVSRAVPLIGGFVK